MGKVKFKSCKATSHCLKFQTPNYARGEWYHKISHGQGSFTSIETLPVNCNYGTQIVRNRGQWFAIFPKKVDNSAAAANKVIALDPGIRTFLTGFDGDNFLEFGSGDMGRIVRLCMKLDDLLSSAARSDSKKQRRSMRKAALRMRIRIRNLVDEVHRKVAAYLVEQYHVIFLPTFETSNMVKKGARKINKKSVRSMLTWSHYRFKQHPQTISSPIWRNCGRCQ